MSSKASFVLLIFAILIDLTVVPSYAAESHAESYWKAKLGNIPMPQALKNSLLLGSNDGSAKLNHNSVYRLWHQQRSTNQLESTNFISYGGGHQQRSANHLDSTNFINYGRQQRHSTNHLESTNFINYGKHQQRSANHPDSTNFITYGGGHQQRSANHLESTNFVNYGKHQQRSANHPESTNFINYGGGHQRRSANHPESTNFVNYGKHQQRSANHLESTNFINYGKHQQRSANHPDSTNFISYGGGHQQRSVNHPESTNFISYGGGHQQRSVNHPESTNFISYGGGHQQHPANHPESTNTVGSSDGQVLFFTNKVLLGPPGAKMMLHFSKIDNKSKFLPLQIAKSMPTSSNKLQVILNLLSVNPKSVEAQDIENTLKECEEGGVTDEVRHCTTSLEAMIDYVTLNLSSAKNKLKVLSTEQDEEILMEYRIQKAEKLGNNDDNNHNLVCHKMSNPYAVFLCHNIKHTNVYGVSLIGANGRKTKAVAVCHMDTSSWDPDHIAFQLLKIKPGSKPICHFLSGDAIVWLPN